MEFKIRNDQKFTKFVDEKTFSRKLSNPKVNSTNTTNIFNKSYLSNNYAETIRKLQEKIKDYETKIMKLEEEIIKQNDLNHTLLKSISRKDEFLLKLMRENNNLAQSYNFMKIINENVTHYNLLNIDEYKLLCQNKSLIYSKPFNLKNTMETLNDDNCFKKNCYTKLMKATKEPERLDEEKKNGQSLSPQLSKLFDIIDNVQNPDKSSNDSKRKSLTNSRSVGSLTTCQTSSHKNTKEPKVKAFEEPKSASKPQQQPIISVTPFIGKVEQYYDKLSEIAKRHGNRKKHGISRQSYLAMKDDFIVKLIKSDNLRELFHITSKEEEFLSTLKNSSEEKLMSLCDSFNNIIRDYLNALRLIFRIKKFLNVSIRVSSAMLIEDATSLIMKNACEILDCDRTTIFVHDKCSNMLTVYQGVGFKLKVPADKGIVGAVFQKGEREKIDDAYLDSRFNQDVDFKTGYKTKSILCVPLKRSDGEVFGVIQAINKKVGLFNADDEELMEYFATQSAFLISNAIYFDENSSFIYRIKNLIDFSINLQNTFKISEFSNIVEKMMNLLWTTNLTKFLLVDNEENKFFQYSNYSKIEISKNLGIIGQVYIKKDLIAVEKAEDSGYYNCLVDIDTGGAIITFPIFDSKFEKVLAIAQSSYPYPLNLSNKKPRENDMILIQYFSTLTSVWLEKNIQKSL